jgi:ribokinase
MPDVVALGDVNVDIIAHFAEYPAKGEDALASWTEMHCGGSAANTAMALARMGTPTNLVARIGLDAWADHICARLDEAGVGRGSLQRDPSAMTGMMYIVVTPDGERTILGHRGANVLVDPNQIDERELAAARLFHLSGYALLSDPQRSAALRALEAARRHGLTVTLDPGMSLPDQAAEEMRTLLPAVDILMPNLAEAQHLTGQAEAGACAQSLLRAGVQVVALKLGREGCLMATREGLLPVPGLAVETQDSTGAGDSFDAGLILGFLGGLKWPSAALLGNALGAMAAARAGAGTADLKTQDVMTLLQAHQATMDRQGLGRASRQAIAFLAKGCTEPREEERP